MSENYYKEFNKKNHEKLQEMLPSMPSFCKDYFIGIEMNTSMLTQLNYARDLCVFFDYLTNRKPELANKATKDITLDDLNAVTAGDIEYYLSYLTYYSYNGTEHENNERAKARKLSSIRSLFKYFYQKDALKENVASKVNVPKIHEKPIIRLDNAEVEEMLEIAEADEKFETSFKNRYNKKTKERDLAILTLLLGTGIRVSECVGLNILDINLEKKSFVVTRKGGNRVVLFMSDEVADALAKYIKKRTEIVETAIAKDALTEAPDALFLSLQIKRISVRAVEKLVKKYAQEASPLKKISPHKLRSTYGTALYRATKDIYVVAEMLGHKDINTTKKHYAAMSEDIRRDASTKVKLRDDVKK